MTINGMVTVGRVTITNNKGSLFLIMTIIGMATLGRITIINNDYQWNGDCWKDHY